MNKYAQLIQPASLHWTADKPLHWADLGCGSGVFTEALASLLPENSSITAIDKTTQNFPAQLGNAVQIEFKKLDFEKEQLPLSDLDGIMMANAFHFLKDKEKLILSLENNFKLNPTFLMIEYDHNKANQWEPFPIPFEEMKKLFQKLNYKTIEKIGEQKSVYGGNMYACYLSKN